jgi:succinate dehydrogenase/fumarate reductase flavoprotein subunit
MNIDRTHQTDVLIVGGGAAAARAAVAAAHAGARSTIVLKKTLGRSGATNYPRKGIYGSAWQAADGCGGPDDTPDAHYDDIMHAALGMADARMARILADESPERLLELERWGFRLFGDPEGRHPHYAGYSCFATQRRAHGMLADEEGGHTGNMVATLAAQFAAAGGEVHADTSVIDVLTSDGQCVGVLAIDADGGLVAYQAGAVVLATGGASQMFSMSSTPGEITGDGYAMAFRAGAELVNLEFMQYMTRVIHGDPSRVGGPFWCTNPIIRNAAGEDVLSAALPAGVAPEQVFWDRTLHYPFSSRDHSKWLDVIMQRELRAGRGTPRGGLRVDFSGVKWESVRRARPQHNPPLGGGVQPGDAEIEVTHSAHAINGGIRVNEFGETAVHGLFAVGETIAGPHGADRLGGGMLAQSNVFGARAGRRAAAFAATSGLSPISAAVLDAPATRLHRFDRALPTTWSDVRRRLKGLAANTLVVARNGTGLSQMVEEVEQLREELEQRRNGSDERARIRVLETENLLLTAELMARAALLRRESRGSHYREDFPHRDDERWLTSIGWRSASGRAEPVLARYRDDPAVAAQYKESPVYAHA